MRISIIYRKMGRIARFSGIKITAHFIKNVLKSIQMLMRLPYVCIT